MVVDNRIGLNFGKVKHHDKEVHRHKVEGGYLEHYHELDDHSRDWEDNYDPHTHFHLIVLCPGRNYISNDTGPAEWDYER